MTLSHVEKVSFLGAGNIAEVWIDRLLSSRTVSPEQVMACDVRTERLATLRQRWNVLTSSRNSEGAEFASIVVLAVPPPVVLSVLNEIRGVLHPGKPFISLAAGVGLPQLESAASNVPVLRVMPNTPALVGEAMNLVAYGQRVSPNDRSRIEPLLDLFGMWFEVPDEELDSWCALCAVGPTYVLPVMEALASAAAASGLSPERAQQAILQVFLGTARMAQRSGHTLPELKEMIGLRTLPEEEVRRIFTGAFQVAVAKLESLKHRLAA